MVWCLLVPLHNPLTAASRTPLPKTGLGSACPKLRLGGPYRRLRELPIHAVEEVVVQVRVDVVLRGEEPGSKGIDPI